MKLNRQNLQRLIKEELTKIMVESPAGPRALELTVVLADITNALEKMYPEYDITEPMDRGNELEVILHSKNIDDTVTITVTKGGDPF